MEKYKQIKFIDTQRVQDILQKKPLPAALPAGLRRSHPAPRDMIMRSGYPAEQVIFLVRGSCTVSVFHPDGRSAAATRYDAVQIFGIAEYLAGRQEYLGDVAAGNNCEIIICPADLFMACLAASPGLSLQLNLYLGALLDRTLSQSGRRLFRSRRRDIIEYFFAGSSGRPLPFVFRIPRDMLASFLGMSPRTLYRSLRELQAEGYISVQRGKTAVTAANREKMRQYLDQRE